MASRALDKLINTRYRRFSESNFLLCKQTLSHEENDEKKNFEPYALNMCCSYLVIMMPTNDVDFQRTHQQEQQKTHEKQKTSEIYVKDVKNIVPKYVMKGYLFTKVILVLIAHQFFCMCACAYAGDFVEPSFFLPHLFSWSINCTYCLHINAYSIIEYVLF